MLNFKKINQIRALSESIVLTPRSTTGIKRLGVGGADHSERDDGYDPFIPKTEKDKKIKAALDKMGQEYQSGKPFSNQRRNESKHTGEGDMAKSQLRSIIANAQEVHDMLEDDDDMSEWVQNKITLSADYISTVREYMKNEVNEGSDLKMAKPSLLTRVKKTNKQNQEKSQSAFDKMFGGGNPADKLGIRKKGVAEETSDAMKDGKIQGHMVNFKPKGNLSGDEVVNKVKDIFKSLQSTHPDKVHKGAYSHGYGDYSFSEKHRGPKSGYVVVKSKEHLDAVKQHIKSHGASIQEEVEQIDEIDKSTVKSYLDKVRFKQARSAVQANIGTPGMKKKHSSELEKTSKSMETAKRRLAKEDIDQMEEAAESIQEISKDTVKSYLDKTVDPVYGMPKHGMKDRIQGIRKASVRLLKKVDNSKTKN